MVQVSLKSYLQFFQLRLKINGQCPIQHVIQFDPAQEDGLTPDLPVSRPFDNGLAQERCKLAHYLS